MEGSKDRMANFELLRILAMLMVVVLHFLSHTGALPAPGEEPGELGILAILIESFSIVAVNCFVLLSGWFLSEKFFSVRRLLRLLCQILFYTLLIPPVLVLLGVLSPSGMLNPYHIWNGLFPVQSGHYWFVTAYVVMMLFSPLLNGAVHTLSRRGLKLTILLLLCFFCFGKSVSPFLLASDRFGYDFGWFLCLYLIAAYLKKYGSTFLYGKKRSGLLYLCSCGLTAALVIVLQLICAKTGAFQYYVSVPFHYNFILALTGALGLFGFFARLRVPGGVLSRLIRLISPAMLGVYLIHEQMDIYSRWALWIVGEVSEHTGGYLIQMAESVLLVFAFCVCVDLLRGRLFAAAERRIGRTGIGKRFDAFWDRVDEVVKR